MEQINSKKQLNDYYNHFLLEDYFSFDIRPYTSVIRFEPNEAILQEGSKPTYLYYMLNGRAKLFLSHKNGSISLINFLSAPCFIGEMELLDKEKKSDGVTAISACICFAVKISNCKKKMLNDTVFLQYLCRFLSSKAIGNTYNYAKNQSYSLRVRLASFILMTSIHGVYRERHTEVAEFLGVTYRHLLFVLAEFVKEGLLIKTDGGYRINKIEELRKTAETQ
jgi:CRP-like cAMP-binding protein